MKPDPDHLIAAAVAGALDDAGAITLAELAGRDPAVRRSLRLHLLIDEIAAQELTPGRGVAAFAAGLAERRRAQDDGFAFLARVQSRLAAEDRVHALLSAPVAPEAPPAIRPRPLQPMTWWPAAAAAAAVLAIVFLTGVTTAPAGAAEALAPSSVLAQAAQARLYGDHPDQERP